MTAVLSTSPTDIPLHADGTAYPFVFVNPAGVAIFGDSRTDIISAIIPGYEDLTGPVNGEDLSLEARLDSLTDLGNQWQAAILAAHAEEDPGEAAALSDDALTALLAPKHVPLVFGQWNVTVPLLLLANNYAPYTDLPAPTGPAIVWIDGYTERDYLVALEALGAGELHTQVLDLDDD